MSRSPSPLRSPLTDRRKAGGVITGDRSRPCQVRFPPPSLMTQNDPPASPQRHPTSIGARIYSGVRAGVISAVWAGIYSGVRATASLSHFHQDRHLGCQHQTADRSTSHLGSGAVVACGTSPGGHPFRTAHAVASSTHAAVRPPSPPSTFAPAIPARLTGSHARKERNARRKGSREMRRPRGSLEMALHRLASPYTVNTAIEVTHRERPWAADRS